MPRRRRRDKRRSWLDQRDKLDLLVGPIHRERVLELRELWFANRDELLELVPAGSRPWGWWTYEAGERAPSGAARAARLAEMGELSEAEIAELRGAGRMVGGIYFEAWEAVALALGRDPGAEPRIVDESVEDA